MLKFNLIQIKLYEKGYLKYKKHCKAYNIEIRIIDLKVDHIMSKVKDGDCFENYQLLRTSCNRVKGAKST